MEALGFLAAAYAAIWIVGFGFIYSMVSRQQTLEKEIKMLEELVKREGEPS